MVRTKHAVVFLIALGLLLVILAGYLLLFRKDAKDDTLPGDEVVFVDEVQEYSVTSEPPEDKEAARKVLIEKLSAQTDESAVTLDSLAEEDRNDMDTQETDGATPDVEGEVPVQATSTEGSTSTLPMMSIEVAGTVQQGTPGSYCWDGACKPVLVTDLPYAAHAISASSTISFSVDAPEEPAALFVFFKEVNGTSTIVGRELTPSEENRKTIALPNVTGEYLLLITGQWLGGNEVSNVFKLLIK